MMFEKKLHFFLLCWLNFFVFLAKMIKKKIRKLTYAGAKEKIKIQNKKLNKRISR